MTDPRFEDLPVPAVHHKRGRPSAVWLVPVIALLAAGGLALRTHLQSGPTIRITFESAEGLEAGKSEVRYKNVTIGRVRDVGITSLPMPKVARGTFRGCGVLHKN